MSLTSFGPTLDGPQRLTVHAYTTITPPAAAVRIVSLTDQRQGGNRPHTGSSTEPCWCGSKWESESMAGQGIDVQQPTHATTARRSRRSDVSRASGTVLNYSPRKYTCSCDRNIQHPATVASFNESSRALYVLRLPPPPRLCGRSTAVGQLCLSVCSCVRIINVESICYGDST